MDIYTPYHSPLLSGQARPVCKRGEARLFYLLRGADEKITSNREAKQMKERGKARFRTARVEMRKSKSAKRTTS